ncbi:endolysin [Enterobacterales bacterium CwR94]|nr:endolysin [Enterobacterales bacterium CwR94]
MTKNEFMRATGLTAELANRWYHPVRVAMESSDIDTPLRQAHFLAQTGVESGGFRHLEESLNYSVEGLKIFGSRLSAEQRERWGRQASEPPLSAARQSEIAECVYGGRYGNVDSGDGWKFRGRGLKQITFRSNYAACGKALGLALEENPDLLLDVMHAACSAGWFWREKGCNQFADSNDVRALTRCINGGFNGLNARISRTLQAQRVLLPDAQQEVMGLL